MKRVLYNFVVVAECSDGLAQVGAKVSADTVLMFGSRIMLGPGDDWLTHCPMGDFIEIFALLLSIYGWGGGGGIFF